MRCLLAVGLVFGLAPWVAAQEAKRLYPEAKHEGGELKYVDGVPVLILEGSSEQIGEAYAELGVKQIDKLIAKTDQFAKSIGMEKIFPVVLKGSAVMYDRFPPHHQKEMDALVKKSKIDRNLLIFANCVPDIHKLGGCSTLVVEPNRSSTKAPLFGRNLDWPPFENLPDYTLVVVFKEKGKRPVACVTLPPLLGCLSGMNDAGLCLTINEINRSKDNSDSFNPEGMPMLFLFRKILEECSTVAEAEKMLNDHKRTTYWCLTACDKKGGCVFEVTPANVVRRDGLEGVCCCTNHFRTEQLSVTTKCIRYPKLEAIQKSKDALGVAEVIKGLDAVNQGPGTMQSMVFEPEPRVLHLSYASGKSATKQPYHKIDLGAIFGK
jgi:predicted choloylglycine hydrolase